METSKVVPPPLGEPPPRLTPPPLAAAPSRAARTRSVSGSPRSTAELLGRRKSPRQPSEHQLCGSGLRRGNLKYLLLEAKRYWGSLLDSGTKALRECPVVRVLSAP